MKEELWKILLDKYFKPRWRFSCDEGKRRQQRRYAKYIQRGEIENGKTLWKIGKGALGAEANRTALVLNSSRDAGIKLFDLHEPFSRLDRPAFSIPQLC